MESNPHEDSINSTEEVDQESEGLGLGRSYECVFCKRGFNTAQALGGHMNIHRKDRARNKPSNHKQDENYTGPRLYEKISSTDYQPVQYPYETSMNYATYFPETSSSTSTRPFYGGHHHQYSHHEHGEEEHTNPFGNDWRMSLSLEFAPDLVKDLETKRHVIAQKEELDLELRLGYDS